MEREYQAWKQGTHIRQARAGRERSVFLKYPKDEYQRSQPRAPRCCREAEAEERIKK
jgi:hypothetical protein